MFQMRFKDAEFVGEGQWICAEETQRSLYLYDERNQLMNFILSVNSKYIKDYGTHIFKFHKVNQTLYMFRKSGLSIYSLDIKAKSMTLESWLDCEDANCERNVLFDEGNIWFMPDITGANLYGYDLDKKKWCTIDALKEWEKNKCLDDSIYLAPVPIMNDGKIWSCIFGQSIFFSIDIKKNRIKEYTIPDVSIAGIHKDGDILWIRRKDTLALIRYELRSSKYIEYIFDDSKYDKNPTYRIIDLGQYLMILPMADNRILIFDKKRLVYEVIYHEKRDKENAGPLWMGYRQKDNDLYLFPNASSHILVFDTVTRSVKRIIDAIPPIEYKRFVSERIFDKGIFFFEEKKDNLKDYIYGITYR